jgi:hypothetical protein
MKNYFKLLCVCFFIVSLTLNFTSHSLTFNWDTLPVPQNSNTIPTHYFLSLDDAINSFNKARELDPSVSASQKKLILPSNFANLSWQDQYFVVLNKERQSRGLLAMTYPIPKLSQISTTYARDLNNANQFTHTLNGTNPISRISTDIALKDCIQYHPYSESLYYYKYDYLPFMTPKLIALIGLYEFLYDDAEVNWGHRKHLLSNYQNDNKSQYNEGHSGIGMSFKLDGNFKIYILAHNTIDPVSGCTL